MYPSFTARSVFPLVAVAALACGGIAHAATMLVDFNAANDLGASKTPDAGGNFWNAITGTNGAGAITSSTFVDVNNVTQVGVSMTLTPYTDASVSTVTTFNGTNGPGWAGQAANSADTGATVTNPLLNQAFAYTDGIFSNGGALGISLSGLVANTTYDISLYGGRTSGGASGTILAVSGYSLTGDTTIENRTVANFSVVSDAVGMIQFNWTDSTGMGGNNALINAMSITAVPEPSVALLGGLGILALLRRRRA